MFKMVSKLISLFSTSLFIMSASAIADERLDASKTLVDEMAKAVKIAIEQDYDTDENRIAAVNQLLIPILILTASHVFQQADIGKSNRRRENRI